MNGEMYAIAMLAWLIGLGMGHLLGRLSETSPEYQLQMRRHLGSVRYCGTCDHWVTPLYERGDYVTAMICPKCREEVDLWLL